MRTMRTEQLEKLKGSFINIMIEVRFNTALAINKKNKLTENTLIVYLSDAKPNSYWKGGYQNVEIEEQ